jgi:hypothetical protein
LQHGSSPITQAILGRLAEDGNQVFVPGSEDKMSEQPVTTEDAQGPENNDYTLIHHAPIQNTVSIDDKLNVYERLADLEKWNAEYLSADEQLKQMRRALNLHKQADVRMGREIAAKRRAIRIMMVQKPFVIKGDLVAEIGYAKIWANLVNQYAKLKLSEKKLWLNNLFFILTPDLVELVYKIADLRGYRSIGQARGLLLAGSSGSGKTTFLNWLTYLHPPIIRDPVNLVKIIKFDAPVNNRTAIDIYRRLINSVGFAYRNLEYEEDYLDLSLALIDACEAEMIVIDEVQHMKKSHENKRKILELSNLTSGIPFLCASVNPYEWAEGDLEMEGRWNDKHTLEPYKGQRLQSLLMFIELLLPFPKSSNLTDYIDPAENPKAKQNLHPANIIERHTKGVLRDIMILLWKAANKAIDGNEAFISCDLLNNTWKEIQTKPFRDDAE